MSFIKTFYDLFIYPLRIKKKTCSIYPPVKLFNVKMGEYVQISNLCSIENSILTDYSSFGSNCAIVNSTIGYSSSINRKSSVIHADIGNYCTISWNVSLGTTMHSYKSISVKHFEEKNQERTIIGNDVWIGANAVVMPGVNVGDGVVIGASAVVTKDLPPYSIAVGIPANIIKYRFDKEIQERLLKLEWWKISQELYQKHYELFKNPPSEDSLEKIEKLLNQ